MLKEFQHTLIENLGIQITSGSSENVEAEMPVDERTCRPGGILHGGASLALAETMAGYGSTLICNDDEIAVGIQVSGNHISQAYLGEIIYGKACIVHLGKSTHIWNVDLFSNDGKLISTVRVTNSILKKR